MFLCFFVFKFKLEREIDMTNNNINGKDILDALKVPFKDSELEWRVQTLSKDGNKALILPYVTNRAIQQRLDDVLGVDWQTTYTKWSDDAENDKNKKGKNGVKCTLSIRINGEWIAREDGAEKTEIESIKGGFSNAMKRAGVQWGLGRYLYDWEQVWVNLQDNQSNRSVYARVKINGKFVNKYFIPPTTEQILKKVQQPTSNQSTQRVNTQNNNQGQSNSTELTQQQKNRQNLEFIFGMAKELEMDRKDVLNVFSKEMHGFTVIEELEENTGWINELHRRIKNIKILLSSLKVDIQKTNELFSKSAGKQITKIAEWIPYVTTELVEKWSAKANTKQNLSTF